MCYKKWLLLWVLQGGGGWAWGRGGGGQRKQVEVNTTPESAVFGGPQTNLNVLQWFGVRMWGRRMVSERNFFYIYSLPSLPKNWNHFPTARKNCLLCVCATHIVCRSGEKRLCRFECRASHFLRKYQLSQNQQREYSVWEEEWPTGFLRIHV